MAKIPILTPTTHLHLIQLLVNKQRTLISALVWLSLMGLYLPLIFLFLFVAVVVVEVLVLLFFIHSQIYIVGVYVHSLGIFFHGFPLFVRGHSISAFSFIYF